MRSERLNRFNTADVLPLYSDTLCPLYLIEQEPALDLLFAQNWLVELLLFVHFADVPLMQDLCIRVWI